MKIIQPWLAWPETHVYSERVPENLHKAIEQFDVEHNIRYRPWLGRTYCNIFVWDVTCALACEIPHWVTKDGLHAPPLGVGARELNANATYQWLSIHGGEHGWQRVASQDEAEMRADLGYPTVPVWYNSEGGSGHIALLLPHGRIAQAGRRNGIMLLEQGFGAHTPDFYTHN